MATRFLSLIVLTFLLLASGHVFAQKKDSTAQKRDSLRYPLQDRRGDRFSWQNRNPFNLNDTGIIKQNIEYDPVTKQYVITEKIGNTTYRTPTTLTYEEFWALQNKAAEDAYFNERSKALSSLNRNILRPKPRVYNKLFDRIFGVGPNGLKVDIKPQGEVNLKLGYTGQHVKNPTLPERAQRNGGFDFDMTNNVNVMASIGDKLKLPINYNTAANFDYMNQLKLDYKGMDDEIIKSVEAGNISFQTKGTLMSSVQSLFGIKTQLQFGRLMLTATIASQRSQRQAVTLSGGGLNQQVNKKLDDYDENRNFLLGQYFRKNYNKAMANLPVINSQVQILRLEVWITNRTGAVSNTRAIVGLMDLAEDTPYNSNVHATLTANNLPDNGSNDLYRYLAGNKTNRDPTFVNTLLLQRGLNPVDDYEKTYAKKLDPSEYYYNPKVGFLCLKQQLQPNDVLAVAYQYTYNGRTYQVGEFSQDVTVDSTSGVQKVLFLKLLKGTSQRPGLPMWQLMMKNVYSLDVSSLQQQGFNINILYQEPSGGTKRYLPESDPSVAGKTLISVLNLDRLNFRNDPAPDGQFDYVDSFTVLSQQGKIIFPVLQPFGRDLQARAFTTTTPDVTGKYIYNQLYDSIKAIAQTYANLNRYLIQGTVKGSSNAEVYLGGFNIPPGSVTVTAGGSPLIENQDYIIDYNLGSLKVINQAILNSGVPVNVQFENNASYGIQQRSFLGLRADYTVNKKLSIGATMERLSERPFFTKEDYGEDPIRNTMYGVDFNYRSSLPSLTRLLDKLPFYTTNAASSINAYGEAALLKPGHAPQIGSGDQGLIYIDDFEGSSSTVDLRFPFVSWALASTPAGNGLFPEARLTDSVAYGMNRAKLAWYNIEPILQDKSSTNNPLRSNTNELSDPRVRAVSTNELFPQRTTNITDVLTSTFDLAYYPTEPGPYNFTADNANITADGKLRFPKQRWGGIMRSLDQVQTDFETGNVEFLEFWVQNPFIKNPGSTGGKLYIDLGNVSEDILKDGRRFYENGLNTPTLPSAIDSSGTWGRTPLNPIQVTQAFSNDPADRTYQDVGLDGLDDNGERVKRSHYLSLLANTFGTTSDIYKKAFSDPSNDDYKWYRDPSYDAAKTGILGRYKNYNNPQGNSPIATNSTQFSPAATLYPDNEDLDRDNTLNETEQYYEYEVDLKPGLGVGSKYITDHRIITPHLANGQGSANQEDWYLYRVPVKEFTNKIGNIPDFKSIRFIRMYLTGFEDSVVMRFATLNLVRNQWRTFTYNLDSTGSYTPIQANTNTSFDLLSVNVESNSSRTPIPYKIPPGIERVQILSNNGVNLLQNEQSMSLRVHNLGKGDARAVFKTLNLDVRRYGQLSMFVHAESIQGQPDIVDGNLYATIRIGQDFLTNYYEVRIPLQVTQPNVAATADQIWPAANNLDFLLQDLVQLKLRRDGTSQQITKIYRETIGTKTYSVMGNPNLAEVQGILIGIQNARTDNTPVNAEVWVDELRLSRIDEQGGYAALGRVDMQLADLGTMSISANTYSHGWGTIEQQVNQRSFNDMTQFDGAINIDAGKVLPKKAGISIPVYASINQTVLKPQYDPFDQDVLYSYKLANAGQKIDSVRAAGIDKTTIKTFNLTNMRFGVTGKRPKLWSISNFDFSYSYTSYLQTNPTITRNEITKQRGGLGYTYNGTQKFIEPFKKMIRSKSPWFALIKDFNFNLTPSLIGFRADMNKQTGLFVPRIVNIYDFNKVQRVDTSYNNMFTFDRYYNFRWDLSRSLNIDFSAINNAVVDMPYGLLNTKAKKDTVRRNFFAGGRNTLYQQKSLVSYALPLAKLPLTDWITARYTYTTTYNWIGASLLALNLGNTIENSKQNDFNAQFNFSQLYTKSKWLTNATAPKIPDGNALNNNPGDVGQVPDSSLRARVDVVRGLKGKARKEALRKWREQKRIARKAKQNASGPQQVNGAVRAAAQLVTMVKSVTLGYTESYNSRIPGYVDSTRILGQNFNSMQPGLDYVFGRQPDTGWLNTKARQGAITRDTNFNLFYQQDFEQHLSLQAQLEPIHELIVDLNLDKTFTKNYTELFKDSTGLGNFKHYSPYAGGGFSVSYISFNTLFTKFKPNQLSETFVKFQNNRQVIANRLAQKNPYWKAAGSPTTVDDKGAVYPLGYGRYSQDVLIPAFIAAYTGKSPNTVALLNQNNANIKSNPFSGIAPLPNWRLTYTGLSKIPALAEIFSNISLTHAYNSTLSMNAFTSALYYYDPLHLGAPAFVDTVSGNYVPFFLVPNLTIQEQFSPLLGIDVTTNKQLNLHFEYKKGRQLSLSLIDYQLSEVRSTGWVFGFGFRKKGVKLPFRLPFTSGKQLQNDLSVRLDLAMQDDTQTNSQLDQTAAFSTGGQKVISIHPSIDYVMSTRVRLKFYFDQVRTIPYISTSAPITNTSAGVQISVSLAPKQQ